MRALIALAFFILLAGCESMQEKVAASRQDRCQRADWILVGERDGVEGVMNAADRMFQPGPYKEGLQKGAARRPRPPV
jgi:hypothetical protein